jgi:hypothetical protein
MTQDFGSCWRISDIWECDSNRIALKSTVKHFSALCIQDATDFTPLDGTSAPPSKVKPLRGCKDAAPYEKCDFVASNSSAGSAFQVESGLFVLQSLLSLIVLFLHRRSACIHFMQLISLGSICFSFPTRICRVKQSSSSLRGSYEDVQDERWSPSYRSTKRRPPEGCVMDRIRTGIE